MSRVWCGLFAVVVPLVFSTGRGRDPNPAPTGLGERGPDPAPGAGELDWVRPRALKKGDTIVFVAPAGHAKKDQIEGHKKRLEKMGFRVVVPDGLYRRSGYLAGTDEERGAEFNAALRDPKTAALFPVAGGFGVTRILDRIDYDALRKNRPVLIGYSDITALHLAAARKARLITFHSPMPQRDLWLDDEPHQFATRSFWRAVHADGYKTGVDGFTVETPADGPEPKKLVGGKAKGRLVGGNLTLLCTTLGTPYAVEAKGNILLIEDVGEKPYRTDRALSQLRLAGVLDEIAGAVVGDFSETDRDEVRRIVKEYFGRLKVPVVTDFPVGHMTRNATVPHGALVELDADAPALRVLENPVAPE